MRGRAWTERERYLVAGVGAFALVVLLAIGLAAYFSSLQDLEDKAERAESLISRLRELQPEIASLRGQLSRQPAMSQRAVSATVLIENTASGLGIRDRLVSLRPQVAPADGPLLESLEVAVESVRLAELVRWLYLLETSPGAHQVSQLRLRKRFDDQELFDATLEVIRFRGGEG